ncbi:MAG: 16S rRNA (guanine(966)-N(2))-methyltransferase RsmD [Firmicutes bacterium]|nr:16S rRNA (guanine(966)-N(2))-methyltransferase RsmD [Bacillota bacterium]
MRIITGTAKGHRLKSLKGQQTRPTADRVKEAVFNVLNPVIAGSHFLDLFAGTGNVGIEALSRGAEYAIFIDENPAACQVIKENLEKTRLLDRAEVYRQDARRAIEILSRRGKQFTLIFVDPPYRQGLVEPVLRLIDQNNLLVQAGWIIVESGANEQLPETVGRLSLFRRATYGDTRISYYQLGGVSPLANQRGEDRRMI